MGQKVLPRVSVLALVMNAQAGDRNPAS